MEAHGAQPDNLPENEMVQLLERDVAILTEALHTIRTTKPKKAAKMLLYRRLAGVQADLEKVNLALDVWRG